MFKLIRKKNEAKAQIRNVHHIPKRRLRNYKRTRKEIKENDPHIVWTSVTAYNYHDNKQMAAAKDDKGHYCITTVDSLKRHRGLSTLQGKVGSTSPYINHLIVLMEKHGCQNWEFKTSIYNLGRIKTNHSIIKIILPSHKLLKSPIYKIERLIIAKGTKNNQLKPGKANANTYSNNLRKELKLAKEIKDYLRANIDTKNYQIVSSVDKLRSKRSRIWAKCNKDDFFKTTINKLEHGQRCPICLMRRKEAKKLQRLLDKYMPGTIILTSPDRLPIAKYNEKGIITFEDKNTDIKQLPAFELVENIRDQIKKVKKEFHFSSHGEGIFNKAIKILNPILKKYGLHLGYGLRSVFNSGLHLDFAIENRERQIICGIEIDGKQHFGPSFISKKHPLKDAKKDYKCQHANDIKKDKLFIKHKTPLFRVYYPSEQYTYIYQLASALQTLMGYNMAGLKLRTSHGKYIFHSDKHGMH